MLNLLLYIFKTAPHVKIISRATSNIYNWEPFQFCKTCLLDKACFTTKVSILILGVPGTILEHLWLVTSFCYRVFTQMPRRNSLDKDSVIKAVEAVREKKMSYKLASVTQRPSRYFEVLH